MKKKKTRYLDNASDILTMAPEKPENDLATQATKLAVGLLTDRYILQLEKNNAHEKERIEKIMQDVHETNTEPTKHRVAFERTCLRPRMWKKLVGAEHGEFSSNRQQDVVEYMQHMFELISRRERVCTRIDKSIPTLTDLFRFQEEERLQCCASQKVRYSTSDHLVLRLPVDMEDAIRKHDPQSNQVSNTLATYTYTCICLYVYGRVLGFWKLGNEQDHLCAKLCDYKGGLICMLTINNEETKNSKTSCNEETMKDVPTSLPIIPFEKCVDRYMQQSTAEDWLSPVTGIRGKAIKSHRLSTFPKYLAIQISRYYLTEQWLPEKHNVEVPVPTELDLECMRAKGAQQDEELMADTTSKEDNDTSLPTPDPTAVNALLSMGMGFTENACKRAALAVSNGSTELAAAWLVEHIGDEDLNDPLPKADTSTSNLVTLDESTVEMLCQNLGFDRESVEVALQHTNGDSGRAADWLFSHMDNLQESISTIKAQQTNKKDTQNSKYTNGIAKYKMFAFISHLGKATSHGHYVVHIKKGSQWYIFNDNYVAKSQEPPFSHGYLYFFERDSQQST
ncbi:hypothetical protein RFI_13031 [Reticulomyxa filosa]|uniref:Uncharacterized protein n=1 Tax=Reticulomyxa filosa TaxID=46433 RepID=X6NFK6_RETFI|nr:hypothetical protein RFI_13031 [Reticulomyxa filosa]|eukprot:ETO24127.1 hypothetical protein RFI_13031 [Reticulomyxa filosa]